MDLVDFKGALIVTLALISGKVTKGYRQVDVGSALDGFVEERGHFWSEICVTKIAQEHVVRQVHLFEGTPDYIECIVLDLTCGCGASRVQQRDEVDIVILRVDGAMAATWRARKGARLSSEGRPLPRALKSRGSRATMQGR
jgi:hypothetical protein